MLRPADLPDFSNPPLNEVVVGVQYDPFEGFSAVDYGAVYSLFADEFPVVREQPPLEPRIETFGGSGTASSAQFDFRPAALFPRLWFVSESEDRLIQFQDDRFLINWRKTAAEDRYPHFEGVLSEFLQNLTRLQEYYADFEHQLKISQAEVTYINIIPVDDFDDLSSWLNIASHQSAPVSALTFQTEEVICDDGKNPTSRFFIELNSVFTKNGKERAFRLNLTYRGRPHPRQELDLSEYLLTARKKIVQTFDEVCTDLAKEKWGKL